jgi:hypothetical protein
MWRYYCKYTHAPTATEHPQPTQLAPLVHRVISRSGRLATRQGPIPPPTSNTTHTRSRPPPPSHLLTEYFHPTPTPQPSWTVPHHPTPPHTPPPVIPLTLSNSFSALAVEPIPPIPDINIPLTQPIPPTILTTDSHPLQATTWDSALSETADHFRSNPIPADGSRGDCLINAFLIGLSTHPRTHNPLELLPAQLRRKIVKYISSPQGTTIRSEHHLTPEMITSILPRDNNEWLELWAIQALQEILRINIQVSQVRTLRPGHFDYVTHTFPHDPTRTTLRLLHSRNGHFDFLSPLRECGSSGVRGWSMKTGVGCRLMRAVPVNGVPLMIYVFLMLYGY